MRLGGDDWLVRRDPAAEVIATSAISKKSWTGRPDQALAFVDQVGSLAETEGHHPNVSFGWGYATVSLQTKKIKGLHENDFIMAAKTDGLTSA